MPRVGRVVNGRIVPYLCIMTVVLLLSALLFLALGAAAPPPKAIIIDTDIFSDVDDIGALAVANSFQRCGLVDIKGVMVNTRSRYGALAASVGLKRHPAVVLDH